jgi:hypothetical protein
MTSPPPFPVRDQRTVDINHLNLLSTFHFVGAGLAVLGLGFLFLHFAIFHTFFENPAAWQQGGRPVTPPPPQFFAIFKIFYAMFGLWFAASAVLNLLSAMYLRARKHRAFSFVVACINCLHFPLGTVLGVFTLVILCRDSVQYLYQSESPPG